MGGNALKNVKLSRLNKKQYQYVVDSVIKRFEQAGFMGLKPILAYDDKDDFGDLDILTPVTITEKDIHVLFGPDEIVKNSNVISFDYFLMCVDTGQDLFFQVDIIKVKPEEMLLAYNYYNFNDLGNLIGRIAHKMGLQYGHDGLKAIVRDGDVKLGEIPIVYAGKKAYYSKSGKYRNELDLVCVYRLLGFDMMDVSNLPIYSSSQFKTLEDIFKFVASSKYFNPDIYLLHNRNNKSRVRDKKRKTYNAFLEWLEKNKETFENVYPWPDVTELGGRRLKNEFIERIDKFFPEIKIYDKIAELVSTHEKAKHISQWINGNVVKECLGIEGKELGIWLAKADKAVLELVPISGNKVLCKTFYEYVAAICPENKTAIKGAILMMDGYLKELEN